MSGAQMRRPRRWGLRGSHSAKSPRGIAARAFRLRTATVCSASRRPPTPLVRATRPPPRSAKVVLLTNGY
jgi:hypothetical protein